MAPLSIGHYLARAIPNCHATCYPNEGHDLSKHMEEMLKTLAEGE